jgi:hypothetical protein
MIAINQHAYIENIVEKFRLTSAKPVSMPMDPGSQFSIDQCPSSLNQIARMHGVPYSEAIGSALWPVVVSCPDAAFANRSVITIHSKSRTSSLERAKMSH